MEGTLGAWQLGADCEKLPNVIPGFGMSLHGCVLTTWTL